MLNNKHNIPYLLLVYAIYNILLFIFEYVVVLLN